MGMEKNCCEDGLRLNGTSATMGGMDHGIDWMGMRGDGNAVCGEGWAWV